LATLNKKELLTKWRLATNAIGLGFMKSLNERTLMDNNFEFSIGAIHQTPTPEMFKESRVVLSKKVSHSGGEEYKFGYVNDIVPCHKCKDTAHG
jgi:hypothetical protein